MRRAPSISTACGGDKLASPRRTPSGAALAGPSQRSPGVIHAAEHYTLYIMRYAYRIIHYTLHIMEGLAAAEVPALEVTPNLSPVSRFVRRRAERPPPADRTNGSGERLATTASFRKRPKQRSPVTCPQGDLTSGCTCLGDERMGCTPSKYPDRTRPGRVRMRL